MKIVSILLAVFSLLLAGCSSKYSAYPLAIKPEYSEQQKIQAAAHWNAIANNEAGLMLKKLASQSALVYVDGNSGGNSVFANAYAELLTSALVQSGTTVLLNSNRVTHTVYYDIQVVHHHNGRGPLPVKPGFLTALAATVFLIDSTENWSHPSLVAVPLLAASEYALYKSKFDYTPVTEVIITTKLKNGNSLISSNSSIYYFNAKDSGHYKDDSQEEAFKVVGISE